MHWIEDGKDVALPQGVAAFTADSTQTLHWTSDGRRHWFRAQVTGPDGKLWLIGNPIYINWDIANDCNGNQPVHADEIKTAR